jgi:streptogramin lyase
MRKLLKRSALQMVCGSVLVAAGVAVAGSAWAGSFSFTTTADWSTGVATNTNTSPPPATGDGHVRLNDAILTPFNHIWVALSGRGTVARIDTNAAAGTYSAAAAGGSIVLGEYRTAPQGQPANPSRTTVDANGDVWVGNRDQGGGALGGSVAKISANPTGTTSTGVWNGSNFNALGWSNAGGVDTDGGTDTASDSANLLYVRTPGVNNVRAVAVDKNNDVWVGGNNNFSGDPRPHQLIDGSTGAYEAGPGTSFVSGSQGGYGMVVDGNGVVWAAGLSGNGMVRYDPATNTTTNIDNGNHQTYGLGIDNNGKIWVSNWTDNTVQRINPTTGAVEGTFGTGVVGMRGVAVTGDNDIWVAASYSNGVMRMNNDGTVQTFIPTGAHPTGVAVDSNGKVWVTNLDGNSVVRIDPTLSGGNGAVDLTVDLGGGANPYNYSDMTGTVLLGSTTPSGTWRKMLDGGAGIVDWQSITFNTQAEAAVPATTGLLMEVRSSLDGITWGDYMAVASDTDLSIFDGKRYLEVRATLSRTGGSDLTPVLSDLRVNFTNGVNTVPEPATMLLFGTGLAGLAAAGRRRRKA